MFSLHRALIARGGLIPLMPVLDDQGRKLDPAEGVHLTTWCYLNGVGGLRLTRQRSCIQPSHNIGRLLPQTSVLLPSRACRQARFAMTQRKETEVYENALDALSKGVETLRDEKNREQRQLGEKEKGRPKRRGFRNPWLKTTFHFFFPFL